MVEMVALAMVVSPRSLACGASLSAAAVEYRRLAMARVLAARMPALLRESVGSRVLVSAVSKRSFAAHAGLSRESSNLSSRLPVQVSWRKHTEKSFARPAAVEEPPELTKKRLSRDERAALVKSFVEKYASENNGEFPTLALVLKETGGSRAVVKDILADLQSSITVKVEVTATPSTEEPLPKVEPPNVAKASSPAAAAGSESEEEDESEEEEEVLEEKTSTAPPPSSSAPEEKITSLKRAAGETPGEINSTYIDILSRLKSLGTERKKEETAAAAESATSETEEKEIKRPSFAARILPPRHGMFVRFLNPAATEEDLKQAFGDCGEITRVSAVKPMKPTAKFTYGFIDFKTADGLSNALRKNVVILGNKVETEAAPTQNTQLSDVAPKIKEPQPAGGGLIDNLVSKVVSMVPPNTENAKNQMSQTPRVWNGQDAPRFSQPGMMNMNKAGGAVGERPDFKPKGMGFQKNEMMPPPRNDMQMPPRNDFPPRNDMPPRMDTPFPRNDMPPPRMDMPPPPPPQMQQPPRPLPPRNENGGFVSPIPPLGDPQKMRKDLSVCVENLPPTTNVTQLRDALAIHGEIYATYLKHRDMNSSTYVFEYLTDEGKESALSAHWVHINGQLVRISRADVPKTTVVRVSNISPSTPDSEFINACKSCGQVERVESRRDRVRDVFYHPAETRNMIKILDRLNEVTINQSRWHAKPAPRCSINMLNRPEGSEFICQQIKALLRNQESMLQQLQIEQRDLRELSMYAVEILNSQNRK
ncbi:WW domain-binding protein 11 [Selaginella moellendorffii]|uniref:WW domain-binding protein 11 n=1 Tax=Selaginella moellendorffii TaxID=88036 RepID=UPI000D1C9483|nr:WW domain-binding protein 11 [Selaginella moellendorffii]|eukprot:XP_024539560.1 WW domain-binding protein 11 [Selaginella moellendorffii]